MVRENFNRVGTHLVATPLSTVSRPQRQISNTACGFPLASHQPLHSARLGA